MNNVFNASTALKTSHDEWKDAQHYEEGVWVGNNKRNSFAKLALKFARALKTPKYFFQLIRYRDFYCGDDWNFWWMEKFDYYKALPKHIHRALEVGSGPYTNIRLISKHVKIDEIVCTDPIMETYKSFKMTWMANKLKKNEIKVQAGMCENIEFNDEHFDLVVCNNVLDHVEDAEKGLSEMFRVLNKGGYFVFAQDLSDTESPYREGHPIRLDHEYLDGLFKQYGYTPVYKKILSREESRAQEYYGTYLLIAQK